MDISRGKQTQELNPPLTQTYTKKRKYQDHLFNMNAETATPQNIVVSLISLVS